MLGFDSRGNVPFAVVRIPLLASKIVLLKIFILVMQFVWYKT